MRPAARRSGWYAKRAPRGGGRGSSWRGGRPTARPAMREVRGDGCPPFSSSAHSGWRRARRAIASSCADAATTDAAAIAASGGRRRARRCRRARRHRVAVDEVGAARSPTARAEPPAREAHRQRPRRPRPQRVEPARRNCRDAECDAGRGANLLERGACASGDSSFESTAASPSASPPLSRGSATAAATSGPALADAGPSTPATSNPGVAERSESSMRGVSAEGSCERAASMRAGRLRLKLSDNLEIAFTAHSSVDSHSDAGSRLPDETNTTDAMTTTNPPTTELKRGRLQAQPRLSRALRADRHRRSPR